MKWKVKKYLMLLAAAAVLLMPARITASAYTQPEAADTGEFPLMEESADTEGDAGTGASADTEDSAKTEEPSGDKTKRDKGGASFSVPGNGQLADEFSDDGTKQFLTIQTKNGNTYFMVLDHSGHSENVYMLSMIDEDDLAEFTRDAETEAEPEEPAVVMPEPESPSMSLETEEGPEQNPDKASAGMDKGKLLAAAVLLAGIIGAYYYFKVWKPKKEEDEEESEEMEFYDGGAYINEDKEGAYDGHEEDV